MKLFVILSAIVCLTSADLICSTCKLKGTQVCGADILTEVVKVFKPDDGGDPFFPVRQLIQLQKSNNASDPISFQCLEGGLRSADCEAQCTKEDCDGDEEYCRGKKCKKDYRCCCKTVHVAITTYGFDESGVQRAGKLISCGVLRTVQAVRKRQAVVSPNTDVFISLENNVVNFNIVPAVPVTVRLSAEGWSWLFKQTTTSFRYVLPDAIRTIDAKIHVEVWSDTGLLRERDFSIQRTLCQVQNNCVICMDVIDNWSCVPTTIKVFFSIFMVLALILMASLIPLIAWLIGTLVAVTRWVLCGLWKIGTNAHNTKLGKMAKKAMAKAGELVEVDEEAQMEVPMQRGPGGTWRRTTPLTIMCLIALSGVQACDVTLTGSFTSQTCTMNGATEDCMVKLQTIATIPAVGATSCTRFTTSTNNRLDLELKWVSMDEYALPEFKYVTCDWRGHVYATTTCPATPHCDLVGGDDCTHLQASNFNAYGQLSGTYITNPGRTSCDSGTAWPFGCFFLGDVCMYSRYTIEPLSDTPSGCYNVYKVSSYYRQAKINVVMKSEKYGVIINDTIDVNKFGFTYNFDLNNAGGVNFNVRALGEFEDQTSTAGLRFLVQNQETGEVRDSIASEAGAPQKLMIGDIQDQNSHYMAPSSNPNAFLFDPSVATKRVIDHYMDYTFESSGISRGWPAAKKFPFDTGARFWKVTYGSNTAKRAVDGLDPHEHQKRAASQLFLVAGSVPQAGALQLEFVNQDADIMITQVVDSVCPLIQDGAISGCYNCDLAPAVTFQAKSTCQTGSASAVIKTPGFTALTGLVELENGFTNVTVKFAGAVNKDVKFEVCLVADSRSSCLNVTGVLSAKVVVQNNTMMGGNMTQVSTGNGFVDFFNSVGTAFEHVFAGIADVWDWLKMIGTILVSVSVVILVIWVAWKIASIRSMNMTKKTN